MTDPTVILITGVSKGIGLRMAQMCLDRPNHIVIGSARDDSAPAVAGLKKAPAGSSKLLLVHIESTSPEDPKKARPCDMTWKDRINFLKYRNYAKTM